MNQPTANRGDLLVVQTRRRAYGMPDWHEFRIGVVTNLTREGRIKKWRPVGRNTPGALEGYDRVYVVSSSKIDVDAALKTATEHAYPSGGVMPYDSLPEVKAALRPHWVVKP